VALPVLHAAAGQQLVPNATALDEALDVIQHGAQSQAASAVNKLAVRLAAGSDRLADLVRRDQDLAAEAEALDKAIIAAVSGATRDSAAENRNKARLAAIAVERAALQKTLAVEFPDYAALSNPLADQDGRDPTAFVRRRGAGGVFGSREAEFCHRHHPQRL